MYKDNNSIIKTFSPIFKRFYKRFYAGEDVMDVPKKEKFTARCTKCGERVLGDEDGLCVYCV